VRNFATTLHGELGTETAIEISGAAGDESGQIGLLLRDVSRRQSAACQPRAMSRLAELDDRIGTTTLTDLVSEASGMIERHCIETALLRSAGNRTAAAALLGMSRQSLYAKLNRYGIGTEETANPGGNQ
jgi:DNA-binding NtrC family response regulator